MKIWKNMLRVRMGRSRPAPDRYVELEALAGSSRVRPESLTNRGATMRYLLELGMESPEH